MPLIRRLPYGCWGTVTPKYVIDQYHSNRPVWIVSLTSVCTTIIGAHFLAVYLSARLYRRGFKWEWWSMTSVLLYCTGLILLMFSGNPVMLPVAIVVFICGEVLMTPCFDETAKKHSTDAGMAAANTFTLERLWGSRIVVKDMGFLLNNNMFGFNLFPGVTDVHGAVGTPPNTTAPGKRMISSMTPTIVAENGHVKLVTGSPGTRAIPNTMLCILVNLFDFGMPVPAAIEAPRFSHEWFPDQISFETPELCPEIVAWLNEMGHTVVRTGPRPQGDAHTIWVVKPNHYVGVADARRNPKASALGY